MSIRNRCGFTSFLSGLYWVSVLGKNTLGSFKAKYIY